MMRIGRIRLRRVTREMSRTTPAWIKWLTPWGTSLAIHGLGLLFLGIIVTALGVEDGIDKTPRFRGQLSDDVTSLHESETSGDPFTTLKSAEPPSLSLDKNSKSEEIRVPRLSAEYVFGPTVNAIPPDPVGSSMPLIKELSPNGLSKSALKGRAIREGAGAFDARLPLMAPFSGRSAEEKARMIRREGGTVESEKAVEDGLEWIARHQRPDGAWALNTHPMCKGAGCPGEEPTMFSDTGATGLALLPMLGAGHKHTTPGRYQKTLERGLFWLIKTQKPSGELFTGGPDHTHYYSHAIATMALCEAYGLTKDKRLRDPAQRAIYYINHNQNKLDGGWRYTFGQAGDTSVFGWQVFAMRSAHLAGLEVNRTVLKRARQYLDSMASDPAGSTYTYLLGRPATFSMTAEGLVCRQMMGWPRDHPSMLAGTANIAAHLQESQERNVYYWYYATQLLHNMRNKDWERWNVKVREGLISMQTVGKGCDQGSWDPINPQEDRWGNVGGRLYVTSLSLLTLEVYYRYLPLYRDLGEDMPGSDRDPDEIKIKAADAAK